MFYIDLGICSFTRVIVMQFSWSLVKKLVDRNEEKMLIWYVGVAKDLLYWNTF